jgi:hypothetical protein
MPKYSLKRLLIFVTVIACGLGFLRAAYWHFTHFETAENLSRVDWLPESATHISYYRSYNFTAYEFDIPEAEFRTWSWWELDEIRQPVEVTRYTLFAKRRPVETSNPTSAMSQKQIDEYRSNFIEVTQGLFHERREADGGGVTVVYDRTSGRAYFQSNPR